MEFPFDLAQHVGAPQDREGPCVGCVDEKALVASRGGALAAVLEELGRKSAVAQGLRKPVTHGSGLGDQRVYILVDGRRALGLLKVGRKRLFVASHQALAFADVQGAFREIEPLCALDFYVHEGCQRRGFGRLLFEAMLQRERTAPSRLGYDRPSPKLLAFLKTHYDLHQFRPQSNNFVVFDSYFDPCADEAPAAAAAATERGGLRGLAEGPAGARRLEQRGTAAAAAEATAQRADGSHAAAASGVQPARRQSDGGHGGASADRRGAGVAELLSGAASADRRGARTAGGHGGSVRDLFGDAAPVRPRVPAVGFR